MVFLFLAVKMNGLFLKYVLVHLSIKDQIWLSGKQAKQIC